MGWNHQLDFYVAKNKGETDAIWRAYFFQMGGSSTNYL